MPYVNVSSDWNDYNISALIFHVTYLLVLIMLGFNCLVPLDIISFFLLLFFQSKSNFT